MIDSLSDFKEFLSVHYFIHLAVSINRQFGERTLTNNTLEGTNSTLGLVIVTNKSIKACVLDACHSSH